LISQHYVIPNDNTTKTRKEQTIQIVNHILSDNQKTAHHVRTIPHHLYIDKYGAFVAPNKHELFANFALANIDEKKKYKLFPTFKIIVHQKKMLLRFFFLGFVVSELFFPCYASLDSYAMFDRMKRMLLQRNE
jgi:hypothetical protein